VVEPLGMWRTIRSLVRVWALHCVGFQASASDTEGPRKRTSQQQSAHAHSFDGCSLCQKRGRIPAQTGRIRLNPTAELPRRICSARLSVIRSLALVAAPKGAMVPPSLVPIEVTRQGAVGASGQAILVGMGGSSGYCRLMVICAGRCVLS